LYKDTKPLSENEFDDSLVVNNDTADMRTASGSIITTRIGFELERMTFGQPPTSQQGEPFADISGFDPVSFLHDPGHTLWPANLWNAGSLPDHEFDGVIEVFDIRREILGQVDLRYEGHAPRGSVMGPFSESPFGSTAITDKWTFADYALSPFLDGPNEMSKDRGTDIPVVARMSFMAASASWTDPNSAMAFPGYQGLEREKLTPFVAEDYHRLVYSKIYNNNPAITDKASYDLTRDFTASSLKFDASSNLIAWWRMGEQVYLDASTNAFTGSFPNQCDPPTPWAQTPSTYIQTTSWAFDGGDDAVAITGNGPTTFNNLIGGSYGAGTLKSYSISFWVRQNNDSGTIFMAGKARTDSSQFAGPGFDVRVTNNGKIEHRRFGLLGAERSYTGLDLAPDNVWAHVVVCWDGKNYSETVPGQADDTYTSIYVNGSKRTLASSTWYVGTGLGYSDFDDFAVIGARATPPWYSIVDELNGSLVDLAIFDKVLTPSNINAIYLASSGSVNENTAHEDPMVTALHALNGSSCATLTNPIDHQANRGFYFGKKAGSIVYGDW
jgi:hypothetical protein